MKPQPIIWSPLLLCIFLLSASVFAANTTIDNLSLQAKDFCEDYKNTSSLGFLKRKEIDAVGEQLLEDLKELIVETSDEIADKSQNAGMAVATSLVASTTLRFLLARHQLKDHPGFFGKIKALRCKNMIKELGWKVGLAPTAITLPTVDLYAASQGKGVIQKTLLKKRLEKIHTDLWECMNQEVLD